MNNSEIKQIREIFLNNENLNHYPDLCEKLFNQYYPMLNYNDFKNADIWHCFVYFDYCSDLLSENKKVIKETMEFGDIPGPVG